MPPKTKPKPVRYLLNAELTPEIRRQWDQLCAHEAARTGQSPLRIGGPLLRRLIREEFHRRFPASPGAG